MDFYPEFTTLLKQQNIHKPTNIQARTQELMLARTDLIALARTGTGKTLAFALPSLLNVKPGSANSLVILEPTTELALQTRDVMQPYVKQLALKITALVGSGNRQRQIEVLKKKRPEVIVATPGRFFDLIVENRIKYNQIKTLILDEADDLLEDAKLEQLTALVDNLGTDAQVAFFGATESDITQHADRYFNREFVVVDVRHEDQTKVAHYFLQVDNQHKLDYLTRLSKFEHFAAIVFFNSSKQAEKFAQILKHTKLSFALLTTQASKEDRKRALKELANGQVKLLLATDLAARGLDIANLPFVINYELPQDLNTYLHRAGRTGRMGKRGQVVSFGTDHDFRDLKKILQHEVDLTRAYFGEYELTTTRPTKVVKEVETKKSKTQVAPVKVQQEPAASMQTSKNPQSETASKKKKKRRKNQKNKGYHPLKDKKK